MVSSYSPHFGEEGPLIGTGGSGTIFMTNCNLNCVFCQNWDISHLGDGVEVSAEDLAKMMLTLQGWGCHNINFVTPSHVVPQILEAVQSAVEGGLTLPLIYNSGGYDSIDTLRLLDGIFDIYMPDFKVWDSKSAQRYLKAPDYPEIAKAAIKEMHRQAGDLIISSEGLALKGLLVRHLVMPGCNSEAAGIMHFIANEISCNTYMNIMDQYNPSGVAHKYASINRRINSDEYRHAIDAAVSEGLLRLDNRTNKFHF